MRPTVVKEEFWRGSQSLEAERIVKAGDLRLRALVKRDAYDVQSYAKVYAWTAKEGWSHVTSIPLERTEVRKRAYVERGDEWRASARKDLDALVNAGLAVLT